MGDTLTDTKRMSFAKGTLWSYGAFAVLGICGVLMNAVIAAAMGPSALGVFNQGYAVYVILSQLSVSGIHYSTLKHVAERASNGENQAVVVISASILTAGVGIVVTGIAAFAARPVGILFDSPAVGETILLASPGLFLFTLNKTLLAVLNGRHHFRALAFGQICRYAVMLTVVIWVAWSDLPVAWLGLAFSLSEAVLIVPLAAGILWPLRGSMSGQTCAWIGLHARFGVKAMLSGLLAEINLRVDILVLGLFTSDHVIGIYSFAAMLAEGFFNLLVVVRTTVNPTLVQLIQKRAFDRLHAFVRKTQRYVYPLAIFGGILLIALFPFVVDAFFDLAFQDSWVLLGILVSGIVLYSGVAPFDAILMQAGLPGYQTLFIATHVGVNVILNLVLIPPYGALGAAIATTMAFAASMLTLRQIMIRKLGFSLRKGAPKSHQ